MPRYLNGQPIRLSTTVTDLTGTLVNASTLSLTVQKPDASTQAYATPTNDSTGKYHQDVPAADLTLNGHYLYVWTATGTGAGVSRGGFDVADPFEPEVLTLQDAKLALNETTTAFDDEIQSYLDSIEANLEMASGGPIVNRSITERVEVSNDYRAIILRKRPLVSVTSITDIATGAAMPLTDLELDTNAGIIRRKLNLPFWSRGPNYTVVYVAGWGTAVPPNAVAAAQIIIQHLWNTQRGRSGRPSFQAEDVTMLPGMSFAIPNRAAELFRPLTLEAYV